MIDFDFKGIRVEATADNQQVDYMDAGNRHRTRFERDVRVFVHFWDFVIWNGNLQELAFVKSCLQYFMQGYWKRATKEGSKIDLAKFLHKEDTREGRLSLYFVARQKDKKHYLQICLQRAGKTVNEIYIDGQEVIMLDIALAKAINLLTPCNHQSNSLLGY
ncbi:MAG: hypothetical protein WCL71_05115 [Deltaproteobacteria bacterium]